MLGSRFDRKRVEHFPVDPNRLAGEIVSLDVHLYKMKSRQSELGPQAICFAYVRLQLGVPSAASNNV